jgi:N,N-dimethylformamidase
LLALTGYADKMSVAPGETIRFMVSAEQDQAYKAKLVRVICGDSNPQGPGLKFRPIPSALEGEYRGKKQTTDAGSFMVAQDLPDLTAEGGLSFAAMIWPTLLDRADQTIMALWDGLAQSGIRLTLQEGGILSLIVADGVGRSASASLPTRVLCRRWYLVRFSIDAAGNVSLAQTALDRSAFPDETSELHAKLGTLPPCLPRCVHLAGCPFPDGGVGFHYNGKLDGPTLFRGTVDDAFVFAHRARALSGPDSKRVLLHWDFSREMSGTAVRDCGPYRCDGRLVHLPARAMKGWNWTGDDHDWRAKPEQYGAIHFHEDDLYDAGWAVSHEWQLPDDIKSGPYALHLSSGENDEDLTRVDYIPFFVRPPKTRAQGANRPKLAFLAPTCSYLAYANESQAIVASELELGLGRLPVLQHADVFLHGHPEYGLSLYDKHADGSGVCYSSRLRPILNFRPNHFSWVGGYGSGLWQFNADTHLFDWLDAKGFDYDVLTDEDLHHEGYGCLADYSVVMTGTHPEYYSTSMWDGLRDWTDRGGSLMYMGGDGFYWRVAFHGTLPGVIEVRRAEDGIRSWESEPGEYRHSFTGELGGLWRRVGRPPNQMCGIGFVAQGFDVSSYYRRASGSRDPRASFIFEGVHEEIIGDFGLIGGGAAGLELDAINHDLGSPLHILRLASSENHSSMVMLVNEEFNVVPPNLGGDQNPRVRADLTFFETPGGGGVFSTGSIAWCGALPHNGYDNNVSRITENVLRRFLAPERFTFPSALSRKG